MIRVIAQTHEDNSLMIQMPGGMYLDQPKGVTFADGTEAATFENELAHIAAETSDATDSSEALSIHDTVSQARTGVAYKNGDRVPDIAPVGAFSVRLGNFADFRIVKGLRESVAYRAAMLANMPALERSKLEIALGSAALLGFNFSSLSDDSDQLPSLYDGKMRPRAAKPQEPIIKLHEAIYDKPKHHGHIEKLTNELEKQSHNRFPKNQHPDNDVQ